MSSTFFRPRSRATAVTVTSLVAALGGLLLSAQANRQAAPPANPSTPLATGKLLTPQGTQTNVGSYPTTLALSPDGKFVLVSSLGARAGITVLDAKTGLQISRVDFGASRPAPAGGRASREGVYYGIAFGVPTPAGTGVYVARGADDKIGVLSLAPDGTLTTTDQTFAVSATGAPPTGRNANAAQIAGLATQGGRIYAASNTGDTANNLRGSLAVLDAATGNVRARVETPGYPYAVVALNSGGKVYVGGEQRNVVTVVDTSGDTPRASRDIAVGSHPVALCLDRAQTRLFVANADSDTVSVINTNTDKVERTMVVRPADARGLPAATPNGVALSPDEKTLYVSLADMNAVAVLDVDRGEVRGYLPAGWNPTAVAISPDGSRLFVANAKGVNARNPNNKPAAVAGSDRPQYIQNIIEGTVSTIDTAQALANLPALTAQTLRNNAVRPGLLETARTALQNPGIEHVIYIIKENRTFDQVLGDLPGGNGDPSLVLFGQAVTPNQHALAQRFVLLDNFYCSAEVSGDGWNWSTAGVADEFTSRNVVYSYTGHSHPYDFEGTNNGVAPDRAGLPDAATPPGGYLWDGAARAKVSLRNYGFFMDDVKLPRRDPEVGAAGLENEPTKKALLGKSSADFRFFDEDYSDGEIRLRYNLAPFASQRQGYGKRNFPSRISAWRYEFDGYVKNQNLPALSLVRLGNDHTQGTKPGVPSPRAMVADNDFAVGQLVEAVSHSPYWRNTAIFIVEDDAQNGFDHVDAHRSIAFVISPFVRRNLHDSRFYNTDSVLHTMENILGIAPMNLYDATAPTLNVFTASPDNDAPYTAIQPSREIAAELNGERAFRAADSRRFFRNPTVADVVPDADLNDILWHSIKGATVPTPAVHHNIVRSAAKAPTRDSD